MRARRFGVVLALLMVPVAAGAHPFSRVISFGDSLTDTGNVSNATFGIAPGSNYFSGRYSNGPLWVEALAGSLNLSAPTPSRTGGRNYAHAGVKTGSGNTTFLFFSFPNAGTQINQYLASHAPAQNDVFTVWAGANDFLGNLAQNPAPIVNNLVNHVTALSNAGARSILVPNLPPLGLTPRYNTDATTSAAYNNLSAAFNSQLDSALISLDAQLPARIYRMDVAGEFMRIVSDPGSFGLTNVTNPALVGSTVVPNVDEYLFYDDVHPTRVGHALLGRAAFDLLSTRAWVAGIGDFTTPGNWDPPGTPTTDWICVVSNATPAPVLARVTGSSTVRQTRLSASSGTAVLEVATGGHLNATEFVHVESGGMLRCGEAGAMVTASRIEIRPGGALLGGRAINGAVMNAGFVAPDAGTDPIGTMTVDGSLTQSSPGTLEMQITDVNGVCDRIDVIGSATLAGTLRIGFDGATAPRPGHAHPLITFASAEEDVQIENATGFAGLRFNKQVTPTSLAVELSAFPGDANLDAIVNIGDFSILAANFNLTGQNWLGGDFNFDTAVTIADFALLAGNFNLSTPLQRSNVPEPAIGIAVLTLALGFRRQQR